MGGLPQTQSVTCSTHNLNDIKINKKVTPHFPYVLLPKESQFPFCCLCSQNFQKASTTWFWKENHIVQGCFSLQIFSSCACKIQNGTGFSSSRVIAFWIYSSCSTHSYRQMMIFCVRKVIWTLISDSDCSAYTCWLLIVSEYCVCFRSGTIQKRA